MFDQVNYIESCIAYYEAKVKSDKESIKNYKIFIKKYDPPDWFVNYFQNCISEYKNLIKKYEASLKYNEARLAQFKIEKFAASGRNFRVIQGGIS